MRRREFIGLVSGMAAWPLMAQAQKSDRTRVIGVLMGFADSDPNAQLLVSAFREALKKLGWMEGDDLRVELRWGAGDPDKMRKFARELVELQPDAILAQTTPVLRAVAAQTSKVPIVFAVVSDPIGGGFATSLTRPGRNISGLTDAEPAMGGKWLQFLKEIAPRTDKAALVFNPATAPPLKFYLPSIEAAASSLGVEVSVAPVHSTDEFDGVIGAQGHKSGGGIVVMPDGFNTTHRDLIIALIARHRVPAIYFNRYFAESGGLIGYGVDYAELFRQAAWYIDRVLRGANVGELPVQLPAKFDLAINLKAAKALGLEVPVVLLASADEVIE
jgi:putative tryptophan/tyrosine transport system substrate-binding protein